MTIPHHSAPPPPDRNWQRVVNQSWPLRDAKGPHARGIPSRPGIAAEVRVVWERDGEQWVAGTAERWTATHVCVRVDDGRLQVPYVWVEARDVRRVTS